MTYINTKKIINEEDAKKLVEKAEQAIDQVKDLWNQCKDESDDIDSLDKAVKILESLISNARFKSTGFQPVSFEQVFW